MQPLASFQLIKALREEVILALISFAKISNVLSLLRQKPLLHIG